MDEFLKSLGDIYNKSVDTVSKLTKSAVDSASQYFGGGPSASAAAIDLAGQVNANQAAAPLLNAAQQIASTATPIDVAGNLAQQVVPLNVAQNALGVAGQAPAIDLLSSLAQDVQALPTVSISPIAVGQGLADAVVQQQADTAGQLLSIAVPQAVSNTPIGEGQTLEQRISNITGQPTVEQLQQSVDDINQQARLEQNASVVKPEEQVIADIQKAQTDIEQEKLDAKIADASIKTDNKISTDLIGLGASIELIKEGYNKITSAYYATADKLSYAGGVLADITGLSDPYSITNKYIAGLTAAKARRVLSSGATESIGNPLTRVSNTFANYGGVEAVREAAPVINQLAGVKKAQMDDLYKALATGKITKEQYIEGQNVINQEARATGIAFLKQNFGITVGINEYNSLEKDMVTLESRKPDQSEGAELQKKIQEKVGAATLTQYQNIIQKKDLIKNSPYFSPALIDAANQNIPGVKMITLHYVNEQQRIREEAAFGSDTIKALKEKLDLSDPRSQQLIQEFESVDNDYNNRLNEFIDYRFKVYLDLVKEKGISQFDQIELDTRASSEFAKLKGANSASERINAPYEDTKVPYTLASDYKTRVNIKYYQALLNGKRNGFSLLDTLTEAGGVSALGVNIVTEKIGEVAGRVSAGDFGFSSTPSKLGLTTATYTLGRGKDVAAGNVQDYLPPIIETYGAIKRLGKAEKAGAFVESTIGTLTRRGATIGFEGLSNARKIEVSKDLTIGGLNTVRGATKTLGQSTSRIITELAIENPVINGLINNKIADKYGTTEVLGFSDQDIDLFAAGMLSAIPILGAGRRTYQMFRNAETPLIQSTDQLLKSSIDAEGNIIQGSYLHNMKKLGYDLDIDTFSTAQNINTINAKAKYVGQKLSELYNPSEIMDIVADRAIKAEVNSTLADSLLGKNAILDTNVKIDNILQSISQGNKVDNDSISRLSKLSTELSTKGVGDNIMKKLYGDERVVISSFNKLDNTKPFIDQVGIVDEGGLAKTKLSIEEADKLKPVLEKYNVGIDTFYSKEGDSYVKKSNSITDIIREGELSKKSAIEKLQSGGPDGQIIAANLKNIPSDVWSIVNDINSGFNKVNPC